MLAWISNDNGNQEHGEGAICEKSRWQEEGRQGLEIDGWVVWSVTLGTWRSEGGE
jgi:hypothetical protein